ncbi:MAG TPA: DUF5615 family PIN-like protein [Gemmataceae bacterium]|nr:DUF5615 family PIN-like protein [Gemmataceae bacterium]
MLMFLLDEHLRGPLWHAIQRHNLKGGLRIDAVRVGDLPDLPLGSDDPSLLSWAEKHGRILITEDKHTMSGHLTNHLKAGNHCPGILMARVSSTLPLIVDCLELIAHAG